MKTFAFTLLTTLAMQANAGRCLADDLNLMIERDFRSFLSDVIALPVCDKQFKTKICIVYYDNSGTIYGLDGGPQTINFAHIRAAE
jgi:hypothetical protein